ncbi:hypothetical protein Enr13x_25840 [Stieleria neptunia]|uniref:Uncharacterized protein n=1 Tax=Stieleria neptunia TaxID=2527979 RepID=A0A518HPG3_9BACT|nr:hypothetical protein Enr13x_25840 [Stieleria neptunia]
MTHHRAISENFVSRVFIRHRPRFNGCHRGAGETLANGLVNLCERLGSGVDGAAFRAWGHGDDYVAGSVCSGLTSASTASPGSGLASSSVVTSFSVILSLF